MPRPLSLEYLKEVLKYNKTTGIFTWRKRLALCIKVGDVAGCSNKVNTYIYIRIAGNGYLAHRLAWFYVYGEMPKKQIDHINGNKLDNRIKNLRDISPRENCQNYAHHRNGRLAGVTYHKAINKWQATIRIKGVRYYLGLFSKEIEAHEAYKKAVTNLERVIKNGKKSDLG